MWKQNWTKKYCHFWMCENILYEYIQTCERVKMFWSKWIQLLELGRLRENWRNRLNHLNPCEGVDVHDLTWTNEKKKICANNFQRVRTWNKICTEVWSCTSSLLVCEKKPAHSVTACANPKFIATDWINRHKSTYRYKNFRPTFDMSSWTFGVGYHFTIQSRSHSVEPLWESFFSSSLLSGGSPAAGPNQSNQIINQSNLVIELTGITVETVARSCFQVLPLPLVFEWTPWPRAPPNIICHQRGRCGIEIRENMALSCTSQPWQCNISELGSFLLRH